MNLTNIIREISYEEDRFDKPLYQFLILSILKGDADLDTLFDLKLIDISKFLENDVIEYDLYKIMVLIEYFFNEEQINKMIQNKIIIIGE